MTDETPRTVYPALHYDDAPAAIEFLERAFGFERGLVVPMDDGRIAHAELRYGTGMIMLGSRPRPEDTGRLQVAYGTTGLYVAVDDADAHHNRAVAAGAEIIAPLVDTDYGSRDYTALDPEGNVWSFGTYRP